MPGDSEIKGLPPIVYEDEHLAAFDKEHGRLVLEDRWDKDAGDLLSQVREKISGDWSHVHRIDRDTSGIILFAKSDEAMRAMRKLFDTRAVEKSYVAITLNTPREESGIINAPIEEDEKRPGRMCVSKRGKESTTDYRVIERWRTGHALVEAHPRTGRTHQIRVHLEHIGAPVVADPLYGSGARILLSNLKRGYKPKPGEEEKPLMGRLALHAQRLEFVHPFTGATVKIEAPLPKDFEITLKYLRKFAGR
jgi:RluA family pseudouridine synthase